MKQWVAMAATIAVLLLGACGKENAAWQQVAPPGGGFSVLMPGTPAEEIHETETNLGTAQLHIYQVVSPDAVYLTSFADLPTEEVNTAEPVPWLHGVARSTFASYGGTVEEAHPVSLNGHPGLAATGTAAFGSIQTQVQGRFYLVDHRLYQTLAVVPQDTATSDPETFLDSFNLTGAEMASEEAANPSPDEPSAAKNPTPSLSPPKTEPANPAPPAATPGQGMLITVGQSDNRISVLEDDHWLEPPQITVENTSFEACGALGGAFFDADGKPWIACNILLTSYDGGKTWEEVPTGLGMAALDSVINIDPSNNQVWWLDDDSYHIINPDNGQVIASYVPEETTGETQFPADAIAFAPDGTVWFGGKSRTGSELVSYDGSVWMAYGTLHDLGAGEHDTVEDVFVTSQGDILIFTGSDVYILREGTLEPFIPSEQTSKIVGGYDMLQTPDGRIWMAGLDGIWVWNGQSLQHFDEASGLPTDHVNQIALDSAGRIWAATNYGLAVQASDMDNEQGWQTAHPATSGLAETRLASLAVQGAPSLPPSTPTTRTASLAGVLVLNGTPVVSTTIELCPNGDAPVFTESPCEGQHVQRATTTNELGEFTFPDLPIGTYELVARNPEVRTWVVLNFLEATNVLDPEQEVDIGELEMAEGLELH